MFFPFIQMSTSLPGRKVESHHPTTDVYAQNNCFVCRKTGPFGLRLEFRLDEHTKQAVCEFQLSDEWEGPPGFTHGGIVATILDEAMAFVNKLHGVIAPTRKMEVEYLKAVRPRERVRVSARNKSEEGRKLVHTAEITNSAGEVLARSEALFIKVDPSLVFGDK